jgi:ergothioneine biosynthesis protein EgtB
MPRNKARQAIESRSRTGGSPEARFRAVREQTMRLAAPLGAEDCAIQSMPDASPVKWHLAHTTWFFETFLLEAFEDRFKPFDPAFRVLFNSYYNSVGDRHPRHERGLITRPDLEGVVAYRRDVDERMARLLQRRWLPDSRLGVLTELGMQHEQQHQELILTDLKHMLSRNPARPAYQKNWPLTTIQAREPHWLPYAGGLVEIGHQGTGFAFDNESPRHRVFLEPFELASHPVRHGDFIAFIADGGYRRPELWLSLGWDTAQARGWTAPLYWESVDGAWHTFTLHGMVPVDPNAPACHLSFFEAEAFARWSGARLPTEAEWEVAAGDCAIEGNFLESQALHPLALREPPLAGVPAQLFGDVWEWTRSDYAPYPGYKPPEGAVGEYNGKFMCSQYVLRGGSCATPRSHLRASYRNFFPPDARWQFSGLRLARDAG